MLKQLLYALLSIVLVNAVWAEQEIVHVDFLKEGYGAGETVQAIINTEPLERPLKAEQFGLYIDGIRKPIAPFFSRYSANSYLLYFDLPIVVNGPVMFKVEKILYSGSGVLEEITVEKEIAILPEPLSILSIIPAFVVLDVNQKEFQIQIENKKGSTGLNITASPSITHPYAERLQTVNFNGKRIFKFTIDPVKLAADDAVFIDHGGVDYKVLVLKREPITGEQNQTTLPRLGTLVFIAAKQEVRKTITPDIMLTGSLSLKNEGNLSLENITLQFIGDIRKITTIDITSIPQLLAGQSQDLTLTINAGTDASAGVYQGILKAEAIGSEATFPLYIEIRAEETPQPLNKTTIDLALQDNTNPPDDPELLTNRSRTTVETTERSYPVGLILMTLALIILGVVFSVMKKKKAVKEENFDDYIKKMRK